MDATQFETILALTFWMFTLTLGLETEKYRSGGLLLFISGWTMFYLETLLPFHAVFVLPFLSSIAIFTIVMGIAKFCKLGVE